MTTFGEVLRSERKKAGKTMGDLGRAIGTSVTYVSDVELGRRPPPANERIVAAAQFLGIDARGLLVAAANARGSIELSTGSATPKQLQVGAGLMRRWAELTDGELEAIEKIIADGGAKEPGEG